MHPSTELLDSWVVLYRILGSIFSDDGPQLVSKSFRTVRLCVGHKKLTVSAHHRRTKDEVLQYNCTLVAALCHFAYNITELGALTYMPYSMCLTQAPLCDKNVSFNVIIRQEPPIATTFERLAGPAIRM